MEKCSEGKGRVSIFSCLFFFFRQLNSLLKMPQLIPFYFLNQISFALITLYILIHIFSKYVLPMYFSLQIIRMFLTRLS